MNMASWKLSSSIHSGPFSKQGHRPQPIPISASTEVRTCAPRLSSGPSVPHSWKTCRCETITPHSQPIRVRIGSKRSSRGKVRMGCREWRLHVVAGAVSSPGYFVGEEPPSDESLGAEEKRRSKLIDRKKRLIAGVDQTELREPYLLADPDSRFVDYYGVQIHHKIAQPKGESDVDPPSSSASGNAAAAAAAAASGGAEQAGKVCLPAILLHGFGASLFSWEEVMPKLAGILGAPVLAFDRPAFGLTSRVLPSPSSLPDEKVRKKFGSFYSVAYSAAAALAFTDFLKFDQTILIGHSAGCLVAVESYFRSPEKVAAMVFVAPALLAPLVIAQIADAKKPHEKGKVDEEVKRENSAPFAQVWKFLLWTWAKLTSLLTAFRRLVSLSIGKLLAVLLRSPLAVWLVRRIMNRGGPFAVRYAFCDATKADEYVVNGYTKPLGCRDWEKALLEYCLAPMHETDDAESRQQELQDIKCPILVVTGDKDRIVPAWNSERLAQVFPNTQFRSIRNCGHLPHEETPDQFLKTIEEWAAQALTKRTSSADPSIGCT